MNLNDFGWILFCVIPVKFIAILQPPGGSFRPIQIFKRPIFLKKHNTTKYNQQLNHKLFKSSLFNIQYHEMTRIHWEKEDKFELEKSFAQNPHPDSAEKQLIADKLRVPIEKIDNFFKNKRQKLRRSGIAVKRVFYNDSPARINISRRVKAMSAKSPPSTKSSSSAKSANNTKPALETVKLEDTSTPPAMTRHRTPVIKIEKDIK